MYIHRQQRRPLNQIFNRDKRNKCSVSCVVSTLFKVVHMRFICATLRWLAEQLDYLLVCRYMQQFIYFVCLLVRLWQLLASFVFVVNFPLSFFDYLICSMDSNSYLVLTSWHGYQLLLLKSQLWQWCCWCWEQLQIIIN